MMVGLLWGMAIPKTPFPRLALNAHLQLTGHGVMFLLAGLVILRLGLGQSGVSRVILLAAPWLTWLQMFSAMVNAWWGAHNILPLAAQAAGAGGAAPWQESVVSGAHLLGALVMLLYWGTILGGLFRGETPASS